MDINFIEEQLKKVKSGQLLESDFEKMLSNISDNKDVFIDKSRKKRCGFPEFIYGEGKSAEQIITAIKRINELNEPVLATRVSEEKYEIIKKEISFGEYDKSSKIYINNNITNKNYIGKVAIITAGTSDIPIAMEAKYTLELCNCKPLTYFDIGVAGIHRLFNKIDEINDADAIICIAGMEGALPSVVAGLTSLPVIAIPTSVGYGTSLKGFTALLAMLTSCASGVSVVNIDNGFGAACSAIRIINMLSKNKDN